MNKRKEQIGQDIFLKAIEKNNDEHNTYVQRKCKGDQELLDYVENLIKAHGQSEEYFVNLEKSISSSHLNEIEDHLFRNVRIKHYQIINVLKQGGMGSLFLAQRSDGEFERTVVIKMLPIDLISEYSRNQFSHEKEILASLIHPNIVQLYDSGMADNGQPYLVMELVKGQSILNHCNNKKLNIKQRIELFHDILSAVGFAHQNSIIHADIKPSNIMVNENNQVKLLDFGIAKLITTHEETIDGFSPAYLTPEHQSQKAINTISDIHQLGQLLFEMLIGIAPNKIKNQKQYYPSLSKTFGELNEDEIAKITINSGELAASIKKQFYSDLTNIIAKSLSLEQSDRYQTVQGFKNDLIRYEKKLCVDAKDNTVSYRLSKFFARNKLLTAFTFSLILFGISFLYLINQHNHELSVERDKAILSKELLLDVFTAADPSISPGTDLTATEVLDIGLQKVREKFQQPSLIEAEFLEQIALTYQSLGKYQKPLLILKDAFEIRQKLQPVNDEAVIKLWLILAENYRLTSNHEEAKLHLNKSIDLIKTIPNSDSYIELLASAKGKLGRIEVLNGKLVEAEKILNQSLALKKQFYGEQHIEYVQALNDLNSVYFRQGKYEEVQNLLLKTKNIRENNWYKSAKGPILDKDYATNINNLGLAYYLHGNLIEGEKYFRQANQLRSLIFVNPHPDQAQSLTNLGLLLNDAGKPSQAVVHLDKALQIRELTLKDGHIRIYDAWNNLALVYHEDKKFKKALEIYTKILDPVLKIQGDSHPQSNSILTNMANTYLELDQFEKAYNHFQKSLNNRLKTLPEKHIYLSYNYIGLGRVETALGNLDQGKIFIEKGLTIRQEKLPQDHWLIGEAYYAMATVKYLQGVSDNDMINKACKILDNKKGQNHYLTIKCQRMLEKQTGKF